MRLTAAFLALLLGSSAAAQQAKGGPRIVSYCLEMAGQPACEPGMWFPEDRARFVLRLSFEHHALSLKFDALDEIARTRRLQISKMRELVEAQRSLTAKATRRERYQRERAAKFEKSAGEAHAYHWAWFAIGILLGGGTVGIIAASR